MIKAIMYCDACGAEMFSTNNPNILNILFADDKNTIFCNEFGQRLREMAPRFPHMGCVQRYRGYAMSQMKGFGGCPDTEYDLCENCTEEDIPDDYPGEG